MTFAITSAVMGQASQLSGCLPASCAARPVDKLVPPHLRAVRGHWSGLRRPTDDFFLLLQLFARIPNYLQNASRSA